MSSYFGVAGLSLDDGTLVVRVLLDVLLVGEFPDVEEQSLEDEVDEAA